MQTWRRAAGAGDRRRSCARPPRAAAALQVGEASKGSIGSSPPSGTATAPIVKSRSARSASIASPRRAVRSTCQERSAATARQVANSAESSNAVPPALARDRPGAGAGSPTTARSRSSTSRPRAASRTAPPTIQIPSPPPSARRTRARAGPRRAALRRSRRFPRHPRRDPAGDLVVDRPQQAGDLLGTDRRVALRTDQHRLVAGLDLGLGPRSTVTLSIETVPTSGWRRPRTSTSALLERPRRTPSP